MKNFIPHGSDSGFSLIEISLSLLLLSYSSVLILRSQMASLELMTGLGYQQDALLLSASVLEILMQNKHKQSLTNDHSYVNDRQDLISAELERLTWLPQAELEIEYSNDPGVSAMKVVIRWYSLSQQHQHVTLTRQW